MATEDTSWTTQGFRQSVVAKIDEAIRSSGMNTSRNSIEMENHVYLKAKNKEEYLGFVARLILHIREMNTKKTNGMSPGQPQGGPGMPDPINALQNLASQGTRNPILNMRGQGQMGGPQQGPTASSLMQTLNRGGQQMMMGCTLGGPNMNQNAGPMGQQMGGQQMAQQMPNQIPIQMQQSNVNPLQNQMNPQMQNQMQNQVPNQMGNQMMGQMQIQMGGNINMQNQMGNQMLAQGQQMNPNRQVPNMMMVNCPPQNFRTQNPQQIFNQAPSPSVQSPASLGQQPVASPALAPSPGSQMMMGSQGPPRSVGMAPSPGASLNTPGQPNQSPMGGVGQDEQAYREKVRQLSKYIEPLRKMIAKIGNDGKDLEKMSKMKKLLEILTNPNQRMPLDTLIKCEVVLEKLDFKRGDSSVPTTTTTHLPFKELNPLLEAVSNNLTSSVINHTLHRTFGPTLDALFGPEIRLVPPLKKLKIEEPTNEIPDILQGEIARLDQRFKVSLDPNQQPGSKSIQLTCWLDDKHLPCVPPVSLVVPEDYPKTAPTCNMATHEYNATPFLCAVQTALLARIKKLPKYFSVSQLLDTWEMSVRQASSPNAIPITTTALLMGM
ncbi:unnamed protein product [Brassicogethes aeneus]|uniref:Mediator of RNA polymerase II transcription subunit 15 n=1 Tax=Brassicogethes aeneus TaxID=1431903 RepID=A0A9P0FJX5_BRAAE|nr:unnamed protein product [Brassicogethes aeneus]